MTTSSTSRRSSASPGATRLRGTPVHALWTDAAHGDQRAVAEGPPPSFVPPGRVVRRLRQVHAAGVVAAAVPVPDGAVLWASGADGAPPAGDALVSTGERFALVVLSADCATVALGSPEGAHAAVHVGWRGLAAGVVPRAVDALRALGASAVVAGMGPCIGACCYEFSERDLDAHPGAFGPEVRATTTRGRPSLDLPAAVRGELSRSGVALVTAVDACTMCHPGYFSHRARGDEARQALLVWRQG